MELEWDCEGCGYHVIALGMDQIPAHRFCSVCAFLCEFVDPAELDSVMARLNRFGMRLPLRPAKPQ